jgi:hypothetical protein
VSAKLRARSDAAALKRWATVRARLALAGYMATRLLDADEGMTVFRVARWRWCQEFGDLEGVEQFLAKLEGTP